MYKFYIITPTENELLDKQINKCIVAIQLLLLDFRSYVFGYIHIQNLNMESKHILMSLYIITRYKL